MARIAGVDLPRDKRVDIGLTYIYGIGRSGAAQIVKKSGVAAATRVKDLKEDEIVKLREIIERDYEVEGDLRKEVSMNIKRLIDTGTYRGLGIARGCRSGDSARGPMPEPGKANGLPSGKRGNQQPAQLPRARSRSGP